MGRDNKKDNNIINRLTTNLILNERKKERKDNLKTWKLKTRDKKFSFHWFSLPEVSRRVKIRALNAIATQVYVGTTRDRALRGKAPERHNH